MAECCLIRKVATVEVYQNKNEVRSYGFMAGDRNTPVMEVKFKYLFGEDNLSECKLRWIIVDDVGSLLLGEVPIGSDNIALINLPNELFNGERRMKVQLTVASCDGERILNLQQFTDLKVINNLTPNEIVEPVYGILINAIYDQSQQYLQELENSYTKKYGGLDSLYKTAKANLEEYLTTAESGGNAQFLQGNVPSDFVKTDNGVATGISIRKEKPILTFKDTRNEGEKGGIVGCLGSAGRLSISNTVTNKDLVLDNDGKIRYGGNEIIDLSKYPTAKNIPGYIKFPSGIIMQWGVGSGSQAITFPIAFSVVPVIQVDGGSTLSAVPAYHTLSGATLSLLTGFSLVSYGYNVIGSSGVELGKAKYLNTTGRENFYGFSSWIAIGY